MRVTSESATNLPRNARARSVSSVGIGSAISAASGILVLFVVSHALTKEENSEFLSFWAALFFVYGAMGGVQTESTRATSHAALSNQEDGKRNPRLVTAGLISGAVGAVVIAALSPVFAAFSFFEHSHIVMLGLVLTAVLYAGHSALAGILQGSSNWSVYGRFLILDALLRLSCISLAAAWSLGLLGLEIACFCALSAWLLLLMFSRVARDSLKVRADVPLKKLLSHIFHAVVSSISSAALIVAFPLLLKLTTPTSVFEQSAPLLLAISMTRAPIMVPLQAFQGVAITHVVKAGSEGWRALHRPLLLLLIVGSFGAVMAFAVGPSLMLLFGPEYKVKGLTLALLTLASVVMAVLTLTGTATLSMGRHRAFSAGWASATAIAFLILLLPLDVEVRCIISLTCGPAVGILIHLLALRKRHGPVVPGPMPSEPAAA
jgi:O-antigen/teichoic acid export membrane protein